MGSESAYPGQIEVQTEFVAGSSPAHEKRQQERRLFEHLQSHAVEDSASKPVQVKITAEEWASLSPETQGNGPLRVGVVKPIDVSIEPARVESSTGDDVFGARRRTKDGGFVWTGVFKVSHVGGLRVHLVGVDLPRGTRLYVYNNMGQAQGPYVGRGPLQTGEFFTHALRGSELRLQLEGKGDGADMPAIGIESFGFTTDQLITGLDQSAYVAGESQLLGQGSFCESNADCIENASCHTDTPAGTAREAVALVLFRPGGQPYYYICTAALVADTDPDSTIPYLITSSICIGDDAEAAASLEAYFDFATSCSSPDCELPSTPDVVGSTLLATDETSGYTLVQLSDNPQTADGIEAYLGWSTTPVADVDGVDLYRISHPQGSPQAYSEHETDTTPAACNIWPRGDFIYSRDTLGGIEGGGTGAPAVNANGQMVGIQMGGCGTNTGDVCDSLSNATVDAAFAAFYPALEPWLSPSYTLTYTAGPNGTISGNATQTVDHGNDGTSVEAVPDTTYSFEQWSDGNTANPRTDKNVTADITVEAQFSIDSYTVSTAVASGNGSIDPTSQMVDHGDAASLTVTPDTGWSIDSVSGCGGSLSGDTYTTGSITADCMVTAAFVINTYTVTFVDHDTSVLDTQAVEHGGDAMTPTDPTREGHTFTGWDVPFDNVTSDLTVTAQYEINTYTLTYAVDANGSLNGVTSQTVDHGNDGTAVEAIPDTGYIFVQWSDSITANPRTDTNVTSDITAVASFAELIDGIFADDFQVE